MLSFTPCTPKEVGLLQNLAITTFTQAFKTQNKPEDFKAYLAAAFSKEQLLLEINNPNTSFFFIYAQDQLVGYCKLNTLTAQNEFKDTLGMELERIYIVKSHQGKGLGAQVLGFAAQQALQQGKTYLWLGVWEHNPNAIRFYQRHGYTKVGEHPYAIGDDLQTDWILKKTLV